MEFKWTDLEPLSGTELAKQAGRARRMVPACTACELHTECQAPVAPGGPRDNYYGVMGEAPGQVEDRKGQPFVGPSGKLLRTMLSRAGLDPDAGLYFNTVQCWPNGGRGKTLTPEAGQIEACKGNRELALSLMQQPYLLLVGSVALKLYRPDLQLGQVQGDVFLWDDKWIVMPIYHPAGILRNTNLKPGVQTALDTFGEVVRGDRTWVSVMRLTCVRCDRYHDRIDEDAVPYCEEHFARYGPSRMAGVVQKRSKKGRVWEELPLEEMS